MNCRWAIVFTVGMTKTTMTWISVQERLPENEFRRDFGQKYLVRVQDVRGGFLRNSFHYEVCDFHGTMIDKEYFSIEKPGIVTHWCEFEKYEEND